MATFSGSPNFAYFVDGADQTGMQPANSSAIGYGADPALLSAPTDPGAPATIASEAIGGDAMTLTVEP